jgi:hypothetical protein
MDIVMEIFFWSAFTACSETKLVLPPGEVETIDDRSAVARAKHHCAELYENSPCARTVERRKHLSYWVICGGYDVEAK